MIQKFLLAWVVFLYLACNAIAGNRSKPEIILPDSIQRQFLNDFYEGLRFKDESNFLLAKDLFKKCETIHPDDPGLLAELSVINSVLDSTDIAIAYMEKAVTLDPDNRWYTSRLIGLYADKKEYEKAVIYAEKLHTKYRFNEDYFNMLISLYKQTGKLQKAIALYNQLEKITGINEMISLDKFRLYMMLNQIPKGNQEIIKLIRKFPNESRYQVFEGDIYLQQKKYDDAYAIYQKVLAEDPANPDVYISLSEYYKTIGDEKKSLDFIMLSLKNAKLDIDTKLEILGQHIEKLLKSNLKIDETESLFKMLVENYPREEKVYNYYAAFLTHQKRMDEATSTYETALEINPKNENNWLTIIQMYFGANKYAKSLKSSNEGLANLPDNVNLLFFKGIALYQLEKYDEALKINQQGINLTDKKTRPDLVSNFYAQIADIFLKKNLNDSAYATYDKALLINPKNIHVLNNYAYYLSLEKKDLRKAEKMSAITVEKEPSNSTYLDTYAWIFYQEGNYSLAKFYIEKAIENLDAASINGEVYEHYGDILWMNGNNDEKAMQMWKKAQDLGNDSESIRQKLKNRGWTR